MTCRLTIFATRPVQKNKRRKPTIEGVAWQDWNRDPRMERAMGRLATSGSFYWPDPRAAYRRAIVVIRQDDTVTAVRIEGIGAQPVAYLRRSDVAPRFGDHPLQQALIERF